MPPNPVQMLVENGPLRGREITVTPDGIRIGRSSNNDVVIKDPALSRFHCRVFFKPDEGLWAMDLGSANQTFINGKPLTEQRVFPGDRLTLGETSIKILSDRPDGVQQEPEKKAAAKEPDATPPDKAKSTKNDQTDAKKDQADAKAAPDNALPGHLFGPAKKNAPAPEKQGDTRHAKWFWPGVVAIVAIFGGIVLLLHQHNSPSGESNQGSAQQAALARELYIRYEKVEASAENIFRYAFLLENGELSIQIDDLKDNRHVTGNQRHKVQKSVQTELADTIERSGFFGGLKDEYRGIAKGVSDTFDIAIAIGDREHRVRVDNSVEPEAFKTLREAIEEFGQNELGLAAMALPPEKLLQLSDDSYRLALTLYGQREVQPNNLWKAIKCMDEAIWYVETIEPKPEHYPDAVAKRDDYTTELQKRYEQHRFNAERAIKLQAWSDAAKELRAICDEIPDRADERHDTARKKLIDVERRLFK